MPKNRTRNKRLNKPMIRYAVVGQGYISQIAVLPSFKNARENSKLVALVSGDKAKLRSLGRKYQVEKLCSYEEYDSLLQSGEIDAVYIALPNHLHYEYALRACNAGIHVLCEKPLAVSESQCEELIRAANTTGVKLMVAYRLHFEETHLNSIELIKKGKVGIPKIFNSVFTLSVNPKNYRAGAREKGGGPVYDIGIYCINAARYLFRSEPIEVSALSFGTVRGDLSDSEETMGVTLRFEQGQAATFTCSFGAFPTSSFQIIGTKGVLTVEDAYEYVGTKTLKVDTKGKSSRRKFRSRDQFAPELIYFSKCIIENREPEPSGVEGLADVRVIEAIIKSATSGQSIRIQSLSRKYPDLKQEIRKPAIKKPELVRAESPSKKEVA